jgi:hypothetical protein
MVPVLLDLGSPVEQQASILRKFALHVLKDG